MEGIQKDSQDCHDLETNGTNRHVGNIIPLLKDIYFEKVNDARECMLILDICYSHDLTNI
ncbi:hypothetical protein T07_1588 [Trichinella nelsoni]|uniref:Uncharacterized protein n=1 Tax=Trichinella nelsoni TaxID=6336 RepID=A0A0V0REF5_9BILA|nr:hypothetical protein T07_1588 [Trichinella nelsoni]